MGPLQIFAIIIQNSGSSIIELIVNIIFSVVKECAKFSLILLLVFSIGFGVFSVGNSCTFQKIAPIPDNRVKLVRLSVGERRLKDTMGGGSFTMYPYVIELPTKSGIDLKQAKMNDYKWWMANSNAPT